MVGLFVPRGVCGDAARMLRSTQKDNRSETLMCFHFPLSDFWWPLLRLMQTHPPSLQSGPPRCGWSHTVTTPICGQQLRRCTTFYRLLPTPTPNISATLKPLTLSWPLKTRKKRKAMRQTFQDCTKCPPKKTHLVGAACYLFPPICFCSWWAGTFDVCWSEHVRHFTGRPCALTTSTAMDLFLASIQHPRLLPTTAQKWSIQFAHHKVLTAVGHSEKRASFQLSSWSLRLRFSDPKMTLLRCWIWPVYLPFIDSKLMKSPMQGGWNRAAVEPPVIEVMVSTPTLLTLDLAAEIRII